MLGGLINNYLPDRGNFDAWVADPEGGAKLDLASLNLIQRRNHILRAALDVLPSKSAQLLSTLSFCPSPLITPRSVPSILMCHRNLRKWKSRSRRRAAGADRLSEVEKAEERKQYEFDLASWKDYEKKARARLISVEHREASTKLTETVTDLERRGLLQYDGRTKRYDLHPGSAVLPPGGFRWKTGGATASV